MWHDGKAQLYPFQSLYSFLSVKPCTIFTKVTAHLQRGRDMLNFPMYFHRGTFTKNISVALSGGFIISLLKKIHMEINKNSSSFLPQKVNMKGKVHK